MHPPSTNHHPEFTVPSSREIYEVFGRGMLCIQPRGLRHALFVTLLLDTVRQKAPMLSKETSDAPISLQTSNVVNKPLPYIRRVQF